MTFRLSAAAMAGISTGTIGASIASMYFFGKIAYPMLTVGLYLFVGFVRAARAEEPSHPMFVHPPLLFGSTLAEMVDIHVQPVLNSNRFSNRRIP